MQRREMSGEERGEVERKREDKGRQMDRDKD